MEQQKNNSKMIFGLAVLWGFWLIGLVFCYIMGRDEGFSKAMNAMIRLIPIFIPILICSMAAGNSLNKLIATADVTQTRFWVIAVLCLLFFPLGLFFLFRMKKSGNTAA